jgi:acetyltransferase
MASSRAGIHKLIAPASAVVIGASPTSNGPGSTVLANLHASALAARVYAVNPRHADREGYFHDVADIPEVTDVAVVAVPARDAVEVVSRVAARGITSVIVMSSGFAESGAEGRAREAELARLALEHELTVLGPNSLGVFNFHSGAHLTFGTVLDGAGALSSTGTAALITQSGAIGSYLCGMARPRQPFRYVISTGNEATLTGSDLVGHFVDDPAVEVIALYLEGVVDGSRMLDAIAAADRAGKRVIVLPAAESAASTAAAASHTAALTSSNRLTRTLVADAGAFVADTPEQLLGTILALQRRGGARGGGIGVISVSGGAGVIVADRLDGAGLTLAELTSPTLEQLRTALPAFGTPGNPTDTTAAAIYDPGILTGALRALAGDPGVHQILTLMGAGGARAEDLARALIAVDAEVTVPHQVVWMACPEPVHRLLEGSDVVVAAGMADAVGVARALTRPHRAHHQDAEPDERGTGESAELTLPPIPAGAADGFLGERESRALLAAAGLPILAARFLPRRDGPGRADSVDSLAVDYPVAVKLQAQGVRHKTELGGVVLDVRDATELRKALAATEDSARRRMPDVVIEGWTVEPMVPKGVEVLVAARVDPGFGPIVVVGAGGVYTELIDDVAVLRAPVTPSRARELLARTAIGRVLDGFRGMTRDLGALCALISRMSRLVVGSPIREVECNPVIVGDDGTVVVVDSLVRVVAPEPGNTRERKN